MAGCPWYLPINGSSTRLHRKSNNAASRTSFSKLYSRRAKMKVPYDVELPQVSELGSTMAYRQAGNPDAPVALFLHGNPTSSYLWRNVISLVAPAAHCIAPDLIGFGQSGKPNIEYQFADHVRNRHAFLG